MTVVSTTVRIPKKLKGEAMELIAEGYYKNLSELMVTALRDEIKEHKPSSSVRYVRERRKELWNSYLKRAKGDSKKAIELMGKDAEKEYAKDPDFWKY